MVCFQDDWLLSGPRQKLANLKQRPYGLFLLMDWFNKFRLSQDRLAKIGQSEVLVFKLTNPRLGEEDPSRTVKAPTLREKLGLLPLCFAKGLFLCRLAECVYFLRPFISKKPLYWQKRRWNKKIKEIWKEENAPTNILTLQRDSLLVPNSLTFCTETYNSTLYVLI